MFWHSGHSSSRSALLLFSGSPPLRGIIGMRSVAKTHLPFSVSGIRFHVARITESRTVIKRYLATDKCSRSNLHNLSAWLLFVHLSGEPSYGLCAVRTLPLVADEYGAADTKHGSGVNHSDDALAGCGGHCCHFVGTEYADRKVGTVKFGPAFRRWGHRKALGYLRASCRKARLQIPGRRLFPGRIHRHSGCRRIPGPTP